MFGQVFATHIQQRKLITTSRPNQAVQSAGAPGACAKDSRVQSMQFNELPWWYSCNNFFKFQHCKYTSLRTQRLVTSHKVLMETKWSSSNPLLAQFVVETAMASNHFLSPDFCSWLMKASLLNACAVVHVSGSQNFTPDYKVQVHPTVSVNTHLGAQTNKMVPRYCVVVPCEHVQRRVCSLSASKCKFH